MTWVSFPDPCWGSHVHACASWSRADRGECLEIGTWAMALSGFIKLFLPSSFLLAYRLFKQKHIYPVVSLEKRNNRITYAYYSLWDLLTLWYRMNFETWRALLFGKTFLNRTKYQRGTHHSLHAFPGNWRKCQLRMVATVWPQKCHSALHLRLGAWHGESWCWSYLRSSVLPRCMTWIPLRTSGLGWGWACYHICSSIPGAGQKAGGQSAGRFGGGCGQVWDDQVYLCNGWICVKSGRVCPLANRNHGDQSADSCCDLHFWGLDDAYAATAPFNTSDLPPVLVGCSAVEWGEGLMFNVGFQE